jgi:tRNA(Ile)-lysidine synthase
MTGCDTPRRCVEAWAAEGLPVRLRCRRVSLSLSAGDSVEAVARAARHAALQDMVL